MRTPPSPARGEGKLRHVRAQQLAFRFKTSNSHAAAPVLFEAPGTPLVFPSPDKARGVARRAAQPVTKYALFLGKSAAPTGAPPENLSSGLFAAFSFRRRAPLSHRS